MGTLVGLRPTRVLGRAGPSAPAAKGMESLPYEWHVTGGHCISFSDILGGVRPNMPCKLKPGPAAVQQLRLVLRAQMGVVSQ